MKFRYLIAALFLCLAVGCVNEEIGTLSEIQLSQSYVSLNVNGGQESISLTASESWQVVESSVPSWLSISPMSGSAGEGVITFQAPETKATKNAEIQIVCAGKTQYINVIQYAAKADPVIISVKEAIDLIKSGEQGGGEYYVKGIVCKIDEISTSYGNATYYLSDDGAFADGKFLEVYRGYWLNSANFTSGDEFAIGDEITIVGVLIDYKGTPETQEKTAYVYAINKSLIKVDEVPEEALPLEGGTFDVKLTCKGDGVSISIPKEAQSWLSVVGVTTSGSTATVTFNALPNNGGDRSTGFTFSTTSGGKTYSAAASVAQAGAIMDVTIAEYLAAAEDDTQYRISGIVTKVAQDSEKYGANLYLKDATGETYIYGTTDKNGNIQTLASFGAKEGDIIELVGKRSSYNGTPQMAKGALQSYKTVTPVKAADVAALADDNKADPQNYIMLTGTVAEATGGNKTDLATYGNFNLVDESGSIYVYGVSTGWKGETKKFGTLGIELGDVITIVAYKTSYKDAAQVVGMYVSHKKGSDVPDDDAKPSTEYSIDLAYSLASSAYDDGLATIKVGNDVVGENVKTIKIGTSSKQGSFNLTLPKNAKTLSFYAVGWYNADPTVQILQGENVIASQTVKRNGGATGNAPYTITVSDDDKYTIDLPEIKEATTVTVTADGRVIFFGIKTK